MKKLTLKKLNNKGFTLIEMMLVLLVISVLVFLVIPNASKYIDKANQTGCKALTESLEAANVAKDSLGIIEDLSELTKEKEAVCAKVTNNYTNNDSDNRNSTEN